MQELAYRGGACPARRQLRHNMRQSAQIFFSKEIEHPSSKNMHPSSKNIPDSSAPFWRLSVSASSFLASFLSILLLLLFVSPTSLQAAPPQWTPQHASDWYAKQPWLVGS